jgi:transposase
MCCLAAPPGVTHPLAVTNEKGHSIVTALPGVVIGADTHLDTVHLAVITHTGTPLADAEFPTCSAGYDAALTWARGFGIIEIAGVEGTSSYGSGLTRVLQAAEIEVAEVSRPDRAARRRKGKSDPLDAYAAARAALAGDGLAVPKDEHTSALRALLTARRSAVKARTAATNQIHALLVTAPDEVRERYRRHGITVLIKALARCRPAANGDLTTVAVLMAAKSLAQRVEFLTHQVGELTAQLDVRVTELNPALRAAYGVGPDVAAQLLVTAGTNPQRLRNEAAFAALCGAAPVPASSGKTTRHRLSRGGDRAANSALHRIALVRMSNHPHTRGYVERQGTNGRTKKEILRLLKRAIAREMFRLLTRDYQIDDYTDLRPAREAKNITLAVVANHFGVPVITVSRLERGKQRNDELATNYRRWLTAA